MRNEVRIGRRWGVGRGWALVMSLIVLALLFVRPVEAAFNLSGSWRTNVNVGRRANVWDVASQSSLGASMRFVPDNRTNVLAVMGVSGSKTGLRSAGQPLAIVPNNVHVGEAYVQVASPILDGGSNWLFRFGAQTPVRHAFLSVAPERDGVTISNIVLGNWNSQLFYLWGGTPDVAFMGVQTAGMVGNVRVGAALADRDGVRQIGVEAHAQPVAGKVNARIGASYAASRMHRIDAAVSATPAPGWKFEYNYRYDEGFNPFSNWPHMAQPSRIHTGKVSTMIAGHSVGAEIQVRNSQLDLTSVAAERNLYVGKTLVGVGYSLANVHTPHPVFGLSGRTTLVVGGLARIALRANANYVVGGGFAWSVQAAHSTSQGLSITAGHHSMQGPQFSVGVSLGF